MEGVRFSVLQGKGFNLKLDPLYIIIIIIYDETFHANRMLILGSQAT